MATDCGEFVIIQCAILEKREKSVMIYHGETDETRFVPNSVIHDDLDDLVEDEEEGIDLHVSKWWAEKEGLT